ncbi:MAG: hypothetical protein ABW163_07755 [Luteimonas sp.]
MPPFSFTLRHSAATFDWELAHAGDSGGSSHHATRSSALDMLAADPQILLRGATVRVFGADGGYERDRTYAPSTPIEGVLANIEA